MIQYSQIYFLMLILKIFCDEYAVFQKTFFTAKKVNVELRTSYNIIVLLMFI